MRKKFYVFLSNPHGAGWGLSGPFSTRKRARATWRINAERPNVLCGPITEIFNTTIDRSKHKFVKRRKNNYEKRLRRAEKQSGSWSIGRDY